MSDWARHKRLCVPVMVKDFGEKGRGLVASKKFNVGDLIFKDKAVVSGISASNNITLADCAKYGKEVYAQVSKLSDTDQKSFFELSARAKVDRMMSHHSLELKSIPENYKRAYSIFSNNSMRIQQEMNEDLEHLYLKISMINHSCDPNSLGYPSDLDGNGKSMELRAIKEIKVDEEVTLSYLDPYTAILGERREKEAKFADWSFQCKCEICRQPEDDRIKKLRDEWNKLELKKKELMIAMKKSKDQSKFLQKYTNTLNHGVDLVIQIDKPLLSFSPPSLGSFCKLAQMGEEACRPDLQKKGVKLLKKHLFEDFDKFRHRYEQSMSKYQKK